MGNHLSIRVCRSMILFHVLVNRYPFAFKKVYKTVKKMLKAKFSKNYFDTNSTNNFHNKKATSTVLSFACINEIKEISSNYC